MSKVTKFVKNNLKKCMSAKILRIKTMCYKNENIQIIERKQHD